MSDRRPAKSVTSQDVSNAITKFATKPPTYDFLVVYFSGHGQWHTRADHWLLSGAPQSTSEAVNLEGAMYTARRSGIPNVVFISDACRTIPKMDVDSLVNGVDAFPNYGIPTISKIDYFKATSDARPAFEIPIGGTTQSVLTHAILSAFENPEPQIVAQIVDGARNVRCCPEPATRVRAAVAGRCHSRRRRRQPDTRPRNNVPSADTVYIARVRPKTVAVPGGAPPAAPAPAAPRRLRRGPSRRPEKPPLWTLTHAVTPCATKRDAR